MKILLKITVSLFFFSTFCFSQQLYFCKSYTEDGKPIEANFTWQIKPWGKQLYVLFDNEGSEIDERLLYLFIDKKNDGRFEPFDSKALQVDDDAEWIVYNYKFIELGEYEFFVVNSKKDTVASEKIIIKLEEELEGTRSTFTTLYYDNTDIVFCERMIAGKPVNEFRQTSLKKNDGLVFIYIINRNQLNTERLYVDFWRKKDSRFEYDEYIGSKKYKMQSGWEDVYFRYYFKEPGEYKVSIYNDNEILIKNGYITITE
jgi:hypothetical protein